MKPNNTRYEYIDDVKMQVPVFDVYELVDGKRVYTTIETRNAVDLWGLD